MTYTIFSNEISWQYLQWYWGRY